MEGVLGRANSTCKALEIRDNRIELPCFAHLGQSGVHSDERQCAVAGQRADKDRELLSGGHGICVAHAV